MTSYFDEHNCEPLPDNQAGDGEHSCRVNFFEVKFLWVLSLRGIHGKSSRRRQKRIDFYWWSNHRITGSLPCMFRCLFFRFLILSIIYGFIETKCIPIAFFMSHSHTHLTCYYARNFLYLFCTLRFVIQLCELIMFSKSVGVCQIPHPDWQLEKRRVFVSLQRSSTPANIKVGYHRKIYYYCLGYWSR